MAHQERGSFAGPTAWRSKRTCNGAWAAKRSSIKAMSEGPLKELKQALERVKAQIRWRVEHPFHVIKKLFSHKKVRYKGLAKNTAQLYGLFAWANLVIVKKVLLVHPKSVQSAA
jgi:transposase, IS5 family